MLTNKHTRQFAWFYLLCFLLNHAWFVYNGLLFSTINPVYFLNRLDLTRNVLMLGNLQHLIMNNYWLRITLDVTYVLLPVALTAAAIKNFRVKIVLAYCTIAFTIVYAIFFSSVCYISMEGYISWILIPIILSASTTKSFYYYLHSVRILFILIFIVAAFTKIRSHAIFNGDQMAAILLSQHSIYLVSNPQNWFTIFINFLVMHKAATQVLFILATIAELSFAAGLFTRKFDKVLIIIFCLFLISDFFLMRINYFTWMVFMGCFYFSKFRLPDEKIQGSYNIKTY